ncbi:bacteriohemerythrin [Piscinibacter sakaiensis]|uniref:bacteriohemerythrin n=1 Tax=Piscinibacter sakaiensis TaxID=1547922 RepID=UPI003AADA420
MNSAATRPFGWHDGFLLGHSPMDDVHEEFVELVAALRTTPDDGVAAVLDALADSAQQHFDAEDGWMVESDFPARDCHIAEHTAVMASITGVRRRVAEGDVPAARRLADALADWFPAHADYLDSALAQWLCKRRLGGKPVVLRRHLDLSALPAVR